MNMQFCMGFWIGCWAKFIQKYRHVFDIWSYYSSVDEDSVLLGYDAVLLGQ